MRRHSVDSTRNFFGLFVGGFMANSKNKVLAKPTSFSIRPDIINTVNKYCDEQGISRSYFITKALESYLKECLEDKADYERAVNAWEKFTKSDGKTYTSDELRKEFDL